MRHLKRRLPFTISVIVLFALLAFLMSSCTKTASSNESTQLIKESEIIAFQNSYSFSFYSITNAIKNEENVEQAAQKHIEGNFGFNDGKVLFKDGNDMDKAFRSTYEGVLSYFIGNSDSFPGDQGFANNRWEKISWNNSGIINNGDMAIVIGRATLTDSDKNVVEQNYTLGLKKNKEGEIKIVIYKTAIPC